MVQRRGIGFPVNKRAEALHKSLSGTSPCSLLFLMLRPIGLALRGSFLLLAMLAMNLPVRAQGGTGTTTFYLPMLQSAGAPNLGIALTNPMLQPAQVTLTARAYSGELIAGDEIANPKTITLPAQGQRALQMPEVFGPGIAGRTGWVALTTSTPAIKGFFTLFDGALTAIDGGAFNTNPASSLIFPNITADTAISYVNTDSNPITNAALSLFDDSGRLIKKRVFNIAAYSGFSGPVAGLIPDAGNFTGYARLDSAGTLFSSSVAVLVGFETYRNRADIAALPAIAPDDILRDGYIGHFVSQGGYYTNLVLLNPTTQAQRVRITTDASGNSVDLTVPAAARIEQRVDQLFGLSGSAVISGYIHCAVQDDGNGIIAFAEYGTSDGLLLSAAAAQGAGLSDIAFSHIAEGGGFYTGIALVNPNTVRSSIVLDAFDQNGQRLASTTVSLAAGERRTQLVHELLPAVTNQLGGYIHLSASRGIFATELFGSSASPNVLANVPAQGEQLPTQGTSRPVSASTGAIVLSNDGSVSVAIPPGALASDTAITVAAISLSNLPSSPGDQRVAGAVEGGPVGITFGMPVKLTFPLAAEFPGGSLLPVLLLNQLTRLYDSTGFTAVVDEDGRNASVDVTHFSTFVVTIPAADVLNVTGISPASGMPGTNVTISGNGFGANPGANVVNFAGPDRTMVPAAVSASGANSITATVPAGAVTGYVTIRSGSRTSLGVVFTVPENLPKPSINSLSPATVFVGTASQQLAINGTGFRPSSSVAYDDAAVTATYVDSTLMLIAPGDAQLKPGIHRIAVTNPSPGGGTSNTVQFSVAYPAPKLSSVTPLIFQQGLPGTMTLTGSGFTRDTTVLIDGVSLQPVFTAPNTLTLPLSSFQPGSHSVSVSNPTPGGGVSNSVMVTTLGVNPVARILLTDPVYGATVSELVVNEGNTVHPNVLVIDTSGAISPAFTPSFTSIDTAIATVDASGKISGKTAGFATLVVNAGDAVAVFTVTVVGVDTGTAGFATTGVAQDSAQHLYLAATPDDMIIRADDLKAAPVVYAGVRQTPGLKNDLRLQSWFKNPAFLALNQADGSLYVADAANNVIRRVSAGASGKVATFAGTGVVGSLDGAAAAATFNNPQGVVLDDQGYVWIADSGNHTIRRISIVSGDVQTIAGQPGTPGFADGNGSSALFSFPMGLAVEQETSEQRLTRQRAGLPPPPVRVLVADCGNGAIRLITANGDVETIAASVSALSRVKGRAAQPSAMSFNSPTGVAIDPVGNIYVTETGSGAVKTILTNGDVVAAVQPNTFASPKGVAITQTGKVVIAGSNAPRQLHYGAPVIAGITPSEVPNTGSVSVTVQGNNFAPGSVLLVGGVIIPQAVVENTHRIRFTVPALPSGVTTVTVQNRGGIAQKSWVIDPVPLALLPAGQITTIAGGATFIGDGVDARSSELLPWKSAVDAFGDAYVVDYLHNRIRKVSSTTGVIITVAGTGEANFSGDGGLATAATLNSPEGLAIDPAGNLFIADTGNHRIRKISVSSGIITTIAGDGVSRFAGDGGPAIAASLSVPGDVAIDPAGNLIIADSGNNRIRRVDQNGNISTIAGNGLTETGIPGDNVDATTTAMNFPEAALADGAGNVIVADTFTQTIRRIGTDGTIHTIAGNGIQGSSTGQLSTPEGLALDASGNLFIADTGNNRIQRLDAITAAVTTIAGTGQQGYFGDNGAATSAKLFLPIGLAVNAAGDILIADALNLRIRKIATGTGIITTVAGSGEFGYLGDSGPASAAGLNFPQGLSFDGSGNLYVTDTNRIRRIAAATGIITTIAGTGQQGYSPDGTTAASASLNGPTGIVVDSLGNIFFAEIGNNMIRKIDVNTGALTTIAGSGQKGYSGDNGPATAAALNGPAVLALDKSQANLYVSDSSNHRIRKINLAGGLITTVAGNGTADYTGNGGPATSATLNYPWGIALDGASNLFIADRLNGVIREVSGSTGTITTIAGNGSFGFGGEGGPAVQAMLNYPLGLAFDAQSNLFFADAGNARIRRITAGTGIIETVVGNGQTGPSVDNIPAVNAALAFPAALLFDKNGNLILADPSPVAARIRAIKAPIP
jgi:sugar lactone lactonase YvrE